MATEKKEKEMVCKNCGYFTSKHPCPNCSQDNFVDKHKGIAYIFDVKKSSVAEKLGAQKHGKYAIKY